MSFFITDRDEQTLCIDDTTYTSPEMTAPKNGKSMLQELFIKKYGADSFHAALADFLAEWFNDSPTILVHTSGSTGVPKELWVEKQRMMNSAIQTLSFLRLQPGGTSLLCMPLQYIAGKMVVVRALVGKLRLVAVPPCGHPMHSLSECPTFAALIPMQVFNSLQEETERQKLMQIHHLIIGGGAVQPEMEKALRPFPHAVWSTYGMTETLSHIALRRLNGPDASEWYTPFEGIRLEQSPYGTLIINAPSLNAEQLVTNDLCEFNSKGCFRILGRKDNTINTGGVKVQIEEIEARLASILDFPFQITAESHPKFGEQIVLLISNTSTDYYDKAQNAVKRLPPYWRPKRIYSVEDLPQTGSGKPDRATARKIVRMLSVTDRKIES